MTIIVYDGVTLAMDGAGIHEGAKVPIVKAWQTIGDEVVAGVGNAAQIAVMRDWYTAGAKSETFPETQRASNPWCELIVVGKHGLKRYENTPSAIQHGHHKCAFGVGKDFAYGALGAGADAQKAAQVALSYAPDTGHGIILFQWKDGNATTTRSI